MGVNQADDMKKEVVMSQSVIMLWDDEDQYTDNDDDDDDDIQGDIGDHDRGVVACCIATGTQHHLDSPPSAR
jgi:hypothetical protein